MQKFEIIIEETVSQSFVVQANDKEQALKIASEKYKNAEFVLEPGELIDVNIEILDNNFAV